MPLYSSKTMLMCMDFHNQLPQGGHNKPPPIYLPCHTTKKMVHGLFMSSGGTMSYVSFTRVWKTTCADIVILPREDVCGTCAQYQSQIARATEEERLTITECEALLGPCPMHIVTIAKDGNGRYRSPTVSQPYCAIVVRRRLRSRRVRESERRLPYRYRYMYWAYM